jgi:glycosyltransferase involved in cell wall biosynthesis
MWDVWRSAGADITFASAADGFEARLARWGRHVDIRMSRSPLGLTRPGLWRDTSDVVRRDWRFVQLQSPIASAVARTVLPRSRPFPVVYVAHGFHFHRGGQALPNLLYRSVEEALSVKVDAVMVVSREDFDAAHSGPIGKRSRVYRLPGAGVDVDRFSLAAPRRLFPPDSLVALFCGELSRAKDPMTAIRAVADARGRGRDVRLLVVGDGALRSQLERYVRHAGADTWLRHIPFSDEVPSLMKGADVLLATSLREGLPRVLVEALAAGLPIVSVSNRGSMELLDGGLGQLVARGSVRRLADALVSFRRDDFPTVGDMHRRAEQYSSARVATAYVAAVTEVLLATQF